VKSPGANDPTMPQAATQNRASSIERAASRLRQAEASLCQPFSFGGERGDLNLERPPARRQAEASENNSGVVRRNQRSAALRRLNFNSTSSTTDDVMEIEHQRSVARRPSFLKRWKSLQASVGEDTIEPPSQASPSGPTRRISFSCVEDRLTDSCIARSPAMDADPSAERAKSHEDELLECALAAPYCVSPKGSHRPPTQRGKMDSPERVPVRPPGEPGKARPEKAKPGRHLPPMAHTPEAELISKYHGSDEMPAKRQLVPLDEILSKTENRVDQEESQLEAVLRENRELKERLQKLSEAKVPTAPPAGIRPSYTRRKSSKQLAEYS